jgi:hypothetical protein
MALDGHDDVYLTGYTEGTLNGQSNGSWFRNSFLCKYTGTGEHLWTEVGMTTSGISYGYALAADGGDVVFMGGKTYGSFDDQIYRRDGDGFVCKYVVPEAISALSIGLAVLFVARVRWRR